MRLVSSPQASEPSVSSDRSARSGGSDPGRSGRALRVDARRNRDRLVEVAARAFASGGPDVSLEGIAREAGVGIGTLYRHFPTREALAEAAYRNEVERLCDAAPTLLASLDPVSALRQWMDQFVDYMAAKRGMGEALRAVVASGADPFAHTKGRLLESVRTLLTPGVEGGLMRDDVSPDDVLKQMSAISLITADQPDRDQARRLLDLLVDGLRYRAS